MTGEYKKRLKVKQYSKVKGREDLKNITNLYRLHCDLLRSCIFLSLHIWTSSHTHTHTYIYIYIFSCHGNSKITSIPPFKNYIIIYTETYSNIMTTSMNELTCFFIKIYLPHFIHKRVAKGVMLVMCERWRQIATYWPQVPLTIAALLLHSCWAAQLWVLRAQALCLELVLTPASYLQLELQLQLELTGTQTPQAICCTWL